MDFNNDKVDINKSLEALKQKLMDLDVLMRNSAMNGNLKKLDNSIIEKYSRSNPFTTINNTICN
ncbi:hypothetical protein QUH73_08495 [Labilibaculum sp. K2S]|uniref:hypothetical protein n=1 Tax=Labilibaculum sp. K2S TaxID=3056386 RepID=UPI0025A48E6C|nr:hypothetical protein [Labilibaculum sp. K2S]MDM8159849.1 hypothetical protein [Labilibaculum sp. K2S]